ncbi:amino acid adenylation domain-containing protein [Costertonia aggregata]|uniref:Amino acid adenylation domain-containing protein n=1 Tax=Costertonia aggregata TaxID=343403 RepID=A0A7H9AT89_9FLAO|nr:amino acid adenylation domain-containing protein [Costertonia aggregata]QLG46693.1 amino acid adenylation domain-containing protein [Costertonia aggregata]
MQSLQKELLSSFEKNRELNAFCIANNHYTYGQLEQKVNGIRNAIRSNAKEENEHMGLVLSDSLETYASILACWLENKAYVPISLTSPKERNQSVLQQAEVHILLSAKEVPGYDEYLIIDTEPLVNASLQDRGGDYDNDSLAYIFFTSGTTGTPKGVPITFSNLIAFCKAFDQMVCTIDHTDKCLQMFELTFDLSVMSYLIPLLKGACVYTIPDDTIKYGYIVELMEDKQLTFALMVPSILQYLRPYFSEINCTSMKNNLFCGEALPLDVTQEWANCIPNATIMNVYGPTEDTIFCTELVYNRSGENKSHNGVLSIGKPMKGVHTIIVNDDQKILPPGEKGELCLGGAQLTRGYWKNPEKNNATFFTTTYMGKETRFYKTGDLCFMDGDGDIMYSGRVDFQAKIQGFRVELSEVELYAKQALDKKNAVAVAFKNKMGNTEIGLVIEGEKMDIKPVMAHMKSKMPVYMIPTQTRFMDVFPLNTNGKTDRKQLTSLFLGKKIENSTPNNE